MQPDARPPRRSRRWRRVLWVLLLLHVGIGLARLPSIVFARRWSDVDDYLARGAPAYFLDGGSLRGADVVQWIVANVPPHAVVLCRGDSKGVLEFVPGMIAPRLLVRDDQVSASAQQHAGRPLASRPGADGTPRVVVVVARAERRGEVLCQELTLEER